jgi:L-aspartate oxidase
LLEGLVYGAHAGAGASSAALHEEDSFRATPLENAATKPPSEPLDLVDIRNSLKSTMWRAAGVRRNGPQLADAAQTIRRWCGYVLSRQLSDPDGWELQNMLTVASLMVEAALAREESRGVHWRIDFPHTDDQNWRRHLTVVCPH